jgi:hypothetical protein
LTRPLYTASPLTASAASCTSGRTEVRVCAVGAGQGESGDAVYGDWQVGGTYDVVICCATTPRGCDAARPDIVQWQPRAPSASGEAGTGEGGADYGVQPGHGFGPAEGTREGRLGQASEAAAAATAHAALTWARKHVVLFGDVMALGAQLPWAGILAAASVCAGEKREGASGEAVQDAWGLLEYQ